MDARKEAAVAEGSYREDQGDASDAVVEAVGKATEALEYVERARGHLYSFHQLTGRADLLFGEAAKMLAEAGEPECAEAVESHVVGRNVLDGRWTFQVVEEYDDLYHRHVTEAVTELERRFQHGRRHVFEARMKEDRRTVGRSGHEHRPKATHDELVETDPA
ncbi:MAG: hypothetical protein ACK4V6_18475 [Microthrixaceae bacterium]